MPDQKTMESVINHENIHSIYEAFNAQSMINYEQVESAFQRIMRNMEAKNPRFMISNNIKLFQQKAKTFFYSSQGELVANFDELLDGNMNTELYKYRIIINNIEKLKDQAVKKKGISEDEHKILVGLAAKFKEDIANNFKVFYTRLSDNIFVAQQEGKANDLQSLMVLFHPKDYHKIGKYFEHEIGADKYKIYQIIRRIIKDPYFKKTDMSLMEKDFSRILFGTKHVNISTPLNLRSDAHPFSRENIKALRDIKNFDFEISESLRQEVAVAMKKENFHILGRELGYKTQTQLQEYIQLVKDLAATLKLDVVIKK